MKICLISVEIFAWGKHGGFGRATRILGRELVARGHTVSAVVPRRPGQAAVEDLDGIKVLGFPPLNPWAATSLLESCNADIYHSCEPSLATYLAKRAMPGRKHIVTFRDPRDLNDWKMEFALPSLNKLQVLHNYFYENNVLVRRTIPKMDGVFTIGKYLVPKVKRMYSLENDPVFLPTPVETHHDVQKSDSPTVCYLARLDRRKRPELFCDLAAQFPDVRFQIMGKSRNKKYESALRAKYEDHPNLEWLGFVDQFASNRHTEVLGESWIMVNAATREALPNAFIEAASHKCAIVSSVDPDGFASQFGFHAENNNFGDGIAYLLKEDRWREAGERGFQYMEETFELTKSMDRHCAIYRDLLER